MYASNLAPKTKRITNQTLSGVKKKLCCFKGTQNFVCVSTVFSKIPRTVSIGSVWVCVGFDDKVHVITTSDLKAQCFVW